MYLREVIEQGTVEEVFGNPKMVKTKQYPGGTFN
jgi:ABC-type phosphate transport system ATPase subunit